MKNIISLAFCLLFFSVMSPAQAEEGGGSYYHDKYEDKKTASGEPYKKDLYTCAHRTLPFGTKIKVTTPDNGKSVIVKVNDRGPFNKHLIVDLSRKAAEEIGLVKAGHKPVRIEVVSDEKGNPVAASPDKEIDDPKAIKPHHHHKDEHKKEEPKKEEPKKEEHKHGHHTAAKEEAKPTATTTATAAAATSTTAAKPDATAAAKPEEKHHKHERHHKKDDEAKPATTGTPTAATTATGTPAKDNMPVKAEVATTKPEEKHHKHERHHKKDDEAKPAITAAAPKAEARMAPPATTTGAQPTVVQPTVKTAAVQPEVKATPQATPVAPVKTAQPLAEAGKAEGKPIKEALPLATKTENKASKPNFVSQAETKANTVATPTTEVKAAAKTEDKHSKEAEVKVAPKVAEASVAPVAETAVAPKAGISNPVAEVKGDQPISKAAASLKESDNEETANVDNEGLYKIQVLRLDYKGWGVQIATYKSYDAVLQHVSELQEDWFKNIMVHVSSNGKKPVYKLILGPFLDQKTAMAYSENIKKRYKIDGFVVALKDLEKK